MLTNLAINPSGDSVYISRGVVTQLIPTLIFGNLPNANIRAPKAGESIALYGYDCTYYDEYSYSLSHILDYDYSIDKSPSMGEKNDSSGMFGTIKGKIYDPKNLLPPDVWLAGVGITDFKPDIDGNFSARITSSNHTIDKLYYSTNKGALAYGYYVEISPVNVNTEPDSTVNVELTITGIVASVENVNTGSESVLKISPNPVKDSFLNYEISIPVKSANSYIEIVGLNGQRIGQFPVYDNSGTIQIPGKIPNGTYTARLFVNNKNYANQKIIISH